MKQLHKDKNMNRISKHIIVAFSAVVTLVSCTKEPAAVPEGSGLLPQGQMREIAVSFGESTKSVLGTTVDETYHKYKPAFCVGDTIKVSNATRSEDCVVVDGGGVLKIFTNLEGELTAIYPASAANVTGNAPIPAANQFRISTTQSGKFSDANICKATIPAESTAANFENQTALLRFYVDESIGVQKITVTGTADIATEGSNKRVITVDPDGTALISSVTEDPDKRICYVAILPGTNTLTFESVTTVQGQGTVSRTMKEGFNYTKNGIFNGFIPYYIDTGTAGRWAYCNVGAFLPEEAGKYFAWGDTEGQYAATTGDGAFTKPFDWVHAPFNNGMSTFDQAHFDTSTVCPGGILALEYDAAYANWGENWSIPTEEMFKELRKHGVLVFQGSSLIGAKFPESGTLFLPNAGWSDSGKDGDGSSLIDTGFSGFYWSRIFNSVTTGEAKLFHFYYSYSSSVDKFVMEDQKLCIGCNIRPVYYDYKGITNGGYEDAGEY